MSSEEKSVTQKLCNTQERGLGNIFINLEIHHFLLSHSLIYRRGAALSASSDWVNLNGVR
jgi:hypothetical protein